MSQTLDGWMLLLKGTAFSPYIRVGRITGSP